MAGPKGHRRATMAGEGGAAAAAFAKAGESGEGRTRRRSGRGASASPSPLPPSLCVPPCGNFHERREAGKAVQGLLRSSDSVRPPRGQVGGGPCLRESLKRRPGTLEGASAWGCAAPGLDLLLPRLLRRLPCKLCGAGPAGGDSHVQQRLKEQAPGFSALHLASLHGRLDCIKMLVERYHVHVDLESTTGWRPVHLVMSKESEGRALECLQYLIEKGADINVYNQKGVTPLHKAASEGRQDCIRVLVEAGADVHAKDIEGQEPIDLCKMWGHRASAKYLANAMWKRDKQDFAQEVSRLNELKEELRIREQEFLKKEQRELDFANSIAFERWLERKCLPLPSDRILGFVKKSLRKQLGKGVSRMAFPTSRALAEQPKYTQMDRDLLQSSWNLSTDVCFAPVTSILQPSTIRMGTEPEKPLEHDFTSFLLLFRDAFGNPELYVSSGEKVSKLPNLPFEVIQKSIYPHTKITRLEGAQDFKPRYIFDVASKRHPSPEHWWTDQMALSLRETLDPAYIGTLKAHLATYTDPRVIFPQLEPNDTSGRVLQAKPSQQLPELNDPLHVARPC